MSVTQKRHRTWSLLSLWSTVRHLEGLTKDYKHSNLIPLHSSANIRFFCRRLKSPCLWRNQSKNIWGNLSNCLATSASLYLHYFATKCLKARVGGFRDAVYGWMFLSRNQTRSKYTGLGWYAQVVIPQKQLSMTNIDTLVLCFMTCPVPK